MLPEGTRRAEHLDFAKISTRPWPAETPTPSVPSVLWAPPLLYPGRGEQEAWGSSHEGTLGEFLGEGRGEGVGPSTSGPEPEPMHQLHQLISNPRVCKPP